jgi:hypothetical protein
MMSAGSEPAPALRELARAVSRSVSVKEATAILGIDRVTRVAAYHRKAL